MEKLKNIHPGEILLEEFLKPMRISQNGLARAIGIPPRHINEIVLGRRAVTADTALRLAQAFGNSVQFWMGLQDEYAVREAREAIAHKLAAIQHLAA
ncbi:MAG TPA: HigA family addiction module antitoxin [Desulfurivibrionaceae bacterium]